MTTTENTQQLFNRLNELRQDVRQMFNSLKELGTTNCTAEFHLDSYFLSDEMVDELEDRDLLYELDTIEVLGHSGTFFARFVGVKHGVIYVIPEDNRVITPVSYSDLLHPYEEILVVSEMERQLVRH